MLKQRARLIAGTILTLDCVLITVAFFAAFWLRHDLAPWLWPASFEGGFYPLASYLPLLPVALAIWAPLLWFSGRYRSHRTVPLRREIAALLRLAVTAAGILILVVYAFRLDERLLAGDKISRLWLFVFPTSPGAADLREDRASPRLALGARPRLNYRTVVIVGSGPRARVARALHSSATGATGCSASSPRSRSSTARRSPAIRCWQPDDLPRFVEQNVVDEVYFAVTRRDLEGLEDLYLSLQEQGILTRLALNFFPHTQAHVELDELDGVPLLTFTTSPNNAFALALKRLLDIVLSFVLLVLGLPVVLLVAIAIKLTSSGSVLFRQTRCGLNGRRFTSHVPARWSREPGRRQRELLPYNEMGRAGLQDHRRSAGDHLEGPAPLRSTSCRSSGTCSRGT